VFSPGGVAPSPAGGLRGKKLASCVDLTVSCHTHVFCSGDYFQFDH
jgi:hypothetical protein